MRENKDEPIRAAIARRRLLQKLGSSAPNIELNSDSPGNLKEDDADKTFQDFLKEEYRNIASAHFNAGTTINQFFQFYLLIIGIPVTGVGVLSRFGGQQFDILKLIESPFAGTVSAAISVTGICMLAHLINLRLEALYYAKAVNGIRKYFYKLVRLATIDELAMRGLPRNMSQPRYWEPLKFGWIVSAFAVLDGLYALAAAWSLITNLAASWNALWAVFWILIVLTFLAVVSLHWLIYAWLVHRQSNHNLRTNIIGCDIDGVIGDHRPAFCKVLSEQNGIELHPNSISKIPLHECTELFDRTQERIAVTQAQEHAVFNHADYWKGMGVYKSAATTLNELRDVYHFKLRLFTYRPWPNPNQYPETLTGASRRNWYSLSPWSWLAGARRVRQGRLFGELYNWFLERCRRRAMTSVTRSWLIQNAIPFDRLIVERGNVHVADPRTKGHNRFRLSELWEVRIFIEDDLNKAKKLADICELVYLIDHPYNQAEELPNNIVRVGKWNDEFRDPWDEIKRHVRENL